MSDAAQGSNGSGSVQEGQSPAPVQVTATKPTPAGELSDQQKMTLAEINMGQPLRKAATAAGVHRATVYRWIKTDPAFRAAYNAWEQEACESARARLLTGVDAAVTKVLDRINYDPKFAFSVLKELGILRPRAAGQIDPERVRQEIELELKALAPPSQTAATRPAPAAPPRRMPPQLATLSRLMDDIEASRRKE